MSGQDAGKGGAVAWFGETRGGTVNLARAENVRNVKNVKNRILKTEGCDSLGKKPLKKTK
jgi:hypothetical protein